MTLESLVIKTGASREIVKKEEGHILTACFPNPFSLVRKRFKDRSKEFCLGNSPLTFCCPIFSLLI